MKKLIILIIAFFVGISTNTFSQPQTGIFNVQYNDRGVISSIAVSVPEDYDSTKSYPFLFGWHGSGDSGNNMRNILYQLLSSRVGAILVCPDINNVLSLDGSYLNNFIDYCNEYTFSHYNIDSTKKIAIGFSMGGGIAYQLGLLNPEIYTGVIGHAPAIGTGQFNQTMWNNITKIKMATILGTLDFNWTAVNALMLEIQNRNGELLYLVKPGVTHVDNDYFNSQEIYDDYMQCYQFVTGETSNIKNQQNISDKLTVTPNPANEYIEIDVNPQLSESYHFQIYNVFGEQIAVGAHCNVPLRIRISDFPDGTYFIRAGNVIEKFVVLR